MNCENIRYAEASIVSCSDHTLTNGFWHLLITVNETLDCGGAISIDAADRGDTLCLWPAAKGIKRCGVMAELACRRSRDVFVQ